MYKLASFGAALAMVTAPIAASAQDYSRHQEAMNEQRQGDSAVPEGANATFNYRKTFGGKKEKLDSSFGFTMEFGQQMGPPDLNGAKDIRTFKVMDLRFDDHGARNFDVAGAQLTDFGREDMSEFQKSQIIGDSTADGLILLYIAVPVVILALATG